MATYKTPGVFIEEIAKLPPSIAEAETAIPAFISYTEITNRDANGIYPVRISSLLEYETIFGKAPILYHSVEIRDTVENNELKNRTIQAALIETGLHNTMYYHIQLYFANGGGPCYIVSVGTLNSPVIDKADLQAGLKALRSYDEPTLLLFPEVANALPFNTPEVIAAYAAAEAADDSGIEADIIAAYAALDRALLQSKADIIYGTYREALQQCADTKNRFLIMDCLENNPGTIRDSEFGIGNNNLQYGAVYHPYINTSIPYCHDDEHIFVYYYVNNALINLNPTVGMVSLQTTNNDLYHIARQAVAENYITLPPCSAIAAVYASVDRTRGVWKAPANVSLNLVNGATKMINDEDQEDLNVDPVGGKSINAIRTFSGKGTLVWGARTLAGNDNEWRYISVRRFFNMVEESVKKAVEAFVFEANDANTWVKVQGMIENYLTGLWREGALQGAKPEQAFYVSVGLGKTMTAQDILEGRMYVEIGMAAVRPAEFIVLRFSHKMAAS